MNIRQANKVKMRAYYNAWAASGQSLKGFCRANSIDYKKMHYWYEKLQSQEEPSSCNDIIAATNNDASLKDKNLPLTSLPKVESSSEHYCTHCHKPFEAFRKDTQYCCSTCKQLAYIKRQQGISNDIAPTNAIAIKNTIPAERSSTSSFKQITLTPDPVVSFVEIHYPSGVIVKLNQAVNLEMLKIFL